MKFIISLLILTLLVTLNASEVNEDKANKYNMYIRGLLKQFSLKPEHEKECIPADWKTDTSKSYIQNETEFINAKTTLALLKEALNKEMTNTCANKVAVIQFLKELHVSAEKKRKNGSSFLQLRGQAWRKSSRKAGKSSKADAAAATKDKAAAAGGKAAAAGGKAAAKGKAPVEEKVKPKYGAFDKLFNDLTKFKTSFHLILKAKMFEETITFVKCYKNAHGVGEGVKKIIQGVEKNLPHILKEIPDFIDSFVHLACKWEDLKSGIESLLKGNNQKDTLQKWEYYGQFVGKLFNVIGS